MIVHERIGSTHLAGNLMDDPSERDLYVYLPPQYEESDRRYPVAYLLHGYGLSAATMVQPPNGDYGWGWMAPLEDVLDPVFTKQGARELIVVIVDGWSKLGCSQYVNSSVNGDYESYIVEEIVAFVDERFRTIPSPDSRAVFGYSSGGFGAWHLGSRNPEVFGVLAMLSGDSYFEVSEKPRFFRFYDAIYPDEPDGPVEGQSDSRLCYGLASCYSPNPLKPPYYSDFPVEYSSGRVLQEIWDQWLSFDPAVNWHDRLDNVRALRGILLDAGTRDEHNYHWGHRLLHDGLTKAGVRHEFQEHDGTHTSRFHERHQVALRWLSEVLEFA